VSQSAPLTLFESLMGWLSLVGPLKLQASFAEYRLFCRALLQKRPIILRSSFAKEIYNFKEPTNRSHPIKPYVESVAGIHRVGCRQLLIDSGVCSYL